MAALPEVIEMEKQSAAKASNLVINGIEYVKNDFYRMQSPAIKTLMGILEKGLYEGRHGLEYDPRYNPKSSIPSIPSPDVKKYLYHVPPLKFADPDGMFSILRRMDIDKGRVNEIEPGYVIKEKYAYRLIALYKATHGEKRISENVYKIKTSDTERFKKAEGISPRKDATPKGVVEPSKPPNQGVVKRTTFIVGPTGGRNQDWRHDMIIKGSTGDGHAAAKQKAAP